MSTAFAGLTLAGMNETPPDYGRWLIHGPQGAGKTTLAATIAALGPTLFIDLVGERGTRSVQGSPWANNVHIARPKSVTELDDIYWALAAGGHPYKAVIIDSLTSLQKMSMRYILGHDETAVKEIRQGTAPADQRSWGQTLDIMTDTATFWFGLADGQHSNPIHVIMTAQTKISDDDFGNTVRTPDVQKGALSITLAAPDYVIYCDVEDNLEAMGDESASPVNHIVRFGADPAYRIKARIPYNLRGKIPHILGRKRPTSLVDLSRVLGIGGIPATKTTPTAPAATASATG